MSYSNFIHFWLILGMFSFGWYTWCSVVHLIGIGASEVILVVVFCDVELSGWLIVLAGFEISAHVHGGSVGAHSVWNHVVDEVRCDSELRRWNWWRHLLCVGWMPWRLYLISYIVVVLVIVIWVLLLYTAIILTHIKLILIVLLLPTNTNTIALPILRIAIRIQIILALI